MPNLEGEPSGLEKLKNALYSRGGLKAPFGRMRAGISRDGRSVPEEWDPSRLFGASRRGVPLSTLKKFFIVAVLFFIGVAVVSAILFFRNSSTFYPDDLEILVQGPLQVKGGEPTHFTIFIANKSVSDLEQVTLAVEYPEGTRTAGDITKDLQRTRKGLDALRAGSIVNEPIDGVFFGDEGEQKSLSITLEYRLAGSNAIFEKNKIHTFLIGSTPAQVKMTLPKEASAGQTVEFTVDVSSQAQALLGNVALELTYPQGFEFKDASPAPASGETFWSLGDMAPLAKRTITIRGVIDGVNEEVKIFKAVVGTSGTGNASSAIAVPYSSAIETSTVKEPSVSVNVSLNGSLGPAFTGQRGQTMRADITWKNNLPVKVSNGELAMTLSGSALDRTSVSAGKGFYRSVDNTIVWNGQSDSSLSEIEPGATGQFSVSFGSLPVGANESLQNAVIDVKIVFGGSRTDQGTGNQTVQTVLSRSIKLGTDLQLAARALHFSGAFQNTGPVPPIAERETLYTIVWSVSNSSNSVSDGFVRATLPQYVRWAGVTSPAGGDLVFNEGTREVSWKVGDIKVGEGITQGAREAAFQVALLPSLSQVGQAPAIISEATLTGTDDFTGTNITRTRSALTTRLSTDAGFPVGGDLVKAPGQ